MTTHALRTSAALLVAVALAGCDRVDDGDSVGSTDDPRARAAYARELIFVSADATGAAMLDFAATDAGSAVRRTARAWAEAGSGWIPLYDLAWQGPPMRQPWRLVPHGPIRLRVGFADEVEAIAVREDDADLALLETGDLVAEWAPFRTTQVILREATLELGGEPMAGWLVDARFGVTRQAADDTTGGFAPNGAEPSPAVAPAAEQAQEDSAPSPSADSLMLEAITPVQAGDLIAVRSIRGVLVTARGETLVVAQTDTGLGGWLWTPDDETTFPIITLTELPGQRATWTLEAGGGATLSGSLTVMDEEPLPVSPRIVRGTIQADGESYEMHGVLRPASAVN